MQVGVRLFCFGPSGYFLIYLVGCPRRTRDHVTRLFVRSQLSNQCSTNINRTNDKFGMLTKLLINSVPASLDFFGAHTNKATCSGDSLRKVNELLGRLRVEVGETQ